MEVEYDESKNVIILLSKHNEYAWSLLHREHE